MESLQQRVNRVMAESVRGYTDKDAEVARLLIDALKEGADVYTMLEKMENRERAEKIRPMIDNLCDLTIALKCDEEDIIRVDDIALRWLARPRNYKR